MRIKKGDEWKAVFSIPENAYELMVMFFGLTNLLATFQAIMNYLLRDMIEVEDMAAFINDVMVGTETEEGHNNIVKEALRRMVENYLCIKLEKYVQKMREVRFLEVVIGLNGVKMKKDKVQEVVDQLVLRSVKDVQKFLVLANYYRQFVKDFAKVTKSLHKMMEKDVKWNLREKQQKVFKELKKRFKIEPVLVTPNLDKGIRVETDMLDFAIGRVLS